MYDYLLVGTDIYEKLIKEYTEKQWGRSCRELPAFIIKRLPLRFTFDNNYFNAIHQAVPVGGYTSLFENLLDGIEVRFNSPFVKDVKNAEIIIYTGAIDEYYDCKFGQLEYRSLRFEHKTFDSDNIQGNAVINYTSHDVPYTRSIEHRHFDRCCNAEKSVVSYEYPAGVGERFYPVNTENNNAIYEKYRELAASERNVIFGGRLGTYSYLDMDKVVDMALNAAAGLLSPVVLINSSLSN